jgi:periplasmic divalent cation tolerance protein
MNEAESISIVMTTVSDRQDADRIAASLVDQCLAACVQIEGPITSLYRWAGKVETSSEFRLVIKTSCQALPSLKQKLAKIHPYQEPEIICLNVDDASEGYRAWVNDQTT